MHRILALSLLCMPLAASAISVSIYQQTPPICGRPSGWLEAWVSGGVPPYTFQWSNGGTDYQITGLYAGNYSVTVTDATMESATDSYTLVAQANYGNGFGIGPNNFPSTCSGQDALITFFTGVDNFQSPPQSSHYGPAPYSFQVQGFDHDLMQTTGCNGTILYNILKVNGGMAGQSYTVNYWDADGCPGSISVGTNPQISWPVIQVLDVSGTCPGSAMGSVAVSVAPQATSGYAQYGLHLRPAASSYNCSSGYMPTANATPTTYTFSGLQPGDHWLVWTTDPLGYFDNYPNIQTACKDSVLVTVPAFPAGCGVLSGSLYVDANGNCTLNGGENRIPETVLEITPGPYYATTNAQGAYSIALPIGTYDIASQHPLLLQSCPANAEVNGNVTSNVACSAPAGLDVMATIGSGPARPGFVHQVSMAIRNLTANATGTVTVTLTFDPILSFISASPAPTAVVGNVITWSGTNVSMWQAFQERMQSVRLQVPPDVGLLGTELLHTVVVSTQNSDADLSNNTASTQQTVTGSYDPNDKLASTSMGSSSVWSIEEDQWIDYTIRFQNTGTDTAFNVVITDTLPPTLNPASIVWGVASHDHSRQLLGEGVLKFLFPNILLPDSNVNEPLSHGFVSFRIRPRLPLLPGDEITNIANIYFDYNPPVITEPSVLVAEFSTGVGERAGIPMLHLMPNPTNGTLWVRLNGEGSGSGLLRIMAYDGRLLMEQLANGPITELDLAALVPGAYLIEWLDNNGQRLVERIIRN
ncbi:MAG: DUF11 domain-containing protein [Flavobacteriales bacterium]|nr:DUF11 domain-containing protein [Flavobacteriales bacterium]